MRLRDLAAGAVFLALLIAVGVGAAAVGDTIGRPDPSEPPEPSSFAREVPPVEGGLFGFESLGRLLALGPWGTVRSVEEREVTVELGGGSREQVPGYVIVIERAGATTELEIPADSPGRVRRLEATELSAGDEVAVREGAEGVALVVTR